MDQVPTSLSHCCRCQRVAGRCKPHLRTHCTGALLQWWMPWITLYNYMMHDIYDWCTVSSTFNISTQYVIKKSHTHIYYIHIYIIYIYTYTYIIIYVYYVNIVFYIYREGGRLYIYICVCVGRYYLYGSIFGGAFSHPCPALWSSERCGGTRGVTRPFHPLWKLVHFWRFSIAMFLRTSG